MLVECDTAPVMLDMNPDLATKESVAHTLPPKVARMRTLGQIGSFGDQLFQYAYLRLYARAHGLVAQIPEWDGDLLFDTSACQRIAEGPLAELPWTVDRFVPLIIDYWGLDWKRLVPQMLDPGPSSRVRVHWAHGRELEGNTGADESVELFGWFQYHTTHYAGAQADFREFFKPHPQLGQWLDQRWRECTRDAGTVVGLHLRRGDRLKFVLNTNEWIAPTSWYRDWLAGIWPTLDRPRLFIASDDLDAVVGDFAQYNPITTRDLKLADSGISAWQNQPERCSYFPDFYFLTRCHELATSNSMFSFSASMLNRSADRFVRPDLQQRRLVAFDPWQAEPIQRRAMFSSRRQKYAEYLQLCQLAGGWRGRLRGCAQIPKFWLWRSRVAAQGMWAPRVGYDIDT